MNTLKFHSRYVGPILSHDKLFTTRDHAPDYVAGETISLVDETGYEFAMAVVFGITAMLRRDMLTVLGEVMPDAADYVKELDSIYPEMKPESHVWITVFYEVETTDQPTGEERK